MSDTATLSIFVDDVERNLFKGMLWGFYCSGNYDFKPEFFDTFLMKALMWYNRVASRKINLKRSGFDWPNFQAEVKKILEELGVRIDERGKNPHQEQIFLGRPNWKKKELLAGAKAHEIEILSGHPDP